MKLIMKTLVFGLSLTLVCNATEAVAQPMRYKIKLDWNDANSLEDSVTQECDDTYYEAIEVTIPGKGYRDFTIELRSDITSGNGGSGCSVVTKKRRNATVYIFDATGFGGCEVIIRQSGSNSILNPKTAIYSIHDAC